MSTLEGVIVGAVILLAVYLTVRQFLKPFSQTKGSCRACGDNCSCETSAKTSKKA